MGCYLSIDSDAHTPSEFDWLLLGCDRVAARGVPADRIVNHWTSDEVRTWTASHEAAQQEATPHEASTRTPSKATLRGTLRDAP